MSQSHITLPNEIVNNPTKLLTSVCLLADGSYAAIQAADKNEKIARIVILNKKLEHLSTLHEFHNEKCFSRNRDGSLVAVGNQHLIYYRDNYQNDENRPGTGAVDIYFELNNYIDIDEEDNQNFDKQYLDFTELMAKENHQNDPRESLTFTVFNLKKPEEKKQITLSTHATHMQIYPFPSSNGFIAILSGDKYTTGYSGFINESCKLHLLNIETEKVYTFDLEYSVHQLIITKNNELFMLKGDSKTLAVQRQPIHLDEFDNKEKLYNPQERQHILSENGYAFNSPISISSDETLLYCRGIIYEKSANNTWSKIHSLKLKYDILAPKANFLNDDGQTLMGDDFNLYNPRGNQLALPLLKIEKSKQFSNTDADDDEISYSQFIVSDAGKVMTYNAVENKPETYNYALLTLPSVIKKEQDTYTLLTEHIDNDSSKIIMTYLNNSSGFFKKQIPEQITTLNEKQCYFMISTPQSAEPMDPQQLLATGRFQDHCCYKTLATKEKAYARIKEVFENPTRRWRHSIIVVINEEPKVLHSVFKNTNMLPIKSIVSLTMIDACHREKDYTITAIKNNEKLLTKSSPKK